MNSHLLNKLLTVGVAALLLAYCGCRKKEAATAAQTASASATGNPLVDKAVATGDPQAVVQAFNQLIEARFMVATSPLTDLEQLVKEGTLKAIPNGPDGRKYAYDAARRQVVLR